jgi:hypothetical protein
VGLILIFSPASFTHLRENEAVEWGKSQKEPQNGVDDENRPQNGFKNEAGAVQTAEEGDERREKRVPAAEKEAQKPGAGAPTEPGGVEQQAGREKLGEAGHSGILEGKSGFADQTGHSSEIVEHVSQEEQGGDPG